MDGRARARDGRSTAGDGSDVREVGAGGHLAIQSAPAGARADASSWSLAGGSARSFSALSPKIHECRPQCGPPVDPVAPAGGEPTGVATARR